MQAPQVKAEVILNWLAAALFFFLIGLRAPQWIKAYSQEGRKVEQSIEVPTTTGASLRIPDQTRKALIFWATWCGPCTLELSRIQSLIDEGKIKPEDVVAIAMDQDTELVKRTSQSRGYTFTVALDPGGQLSALWR